MEEEIEPENRGKELKFGDFEETVLEEKKVLISEEDLVDKLSRMDEIKSL